MENETTIALTTIDLVAATGLVLFAALISLYLRLHLERKILPIEFLRTFFSARTFLFRICCPWSMQNRIHSSLQTLF